MGSKKADANTLAKEVKEFIVNQGADLVGIASAKNLNKKAPRGHRPEDFLPGAQAAVIMGIHMLDTLFHELPSRTDIWSDIFMYANGLVRSSEWKLTKFLESKGFRALPCLGSYPAETQKAPVSLKHFGEEAGLGVFALSNLLVTPEFGPRVRLSGVITDAPLAHDKPLSSNPCKEAQSRCKLACVRGCPTEALATNGKIKRAECYKYYFILPCHGLYQETGINWRCGLCITNCPVGSKVAWNGYKLEPEARKKKSLEITTLNEEELAGRMRLYYSRRKLKPELIVSMENPPI